MTIVKTFDHLKTRLAWYSDPHCFNHNFRAIFEKTGASGKTESYATVALGSRDRSISVWSTNLKRPFFVINDIFEQSVLDLSWSKDGRVLLAW